jgi:hypothetical protein
VKLVCFCAARGELLLGASGTAITLSMSTILILQSVCEAQD